jgi:hypothetical protein
MAQTTNLPGDLKTLKDGVTGLYNSHSPVDEVKDNVKRFYAHDVRFEDPMTAVPTSRLLFIQFVLLRYLLHSYWSLENHALFDEARRTLVIDHLVFYRFFWFLPSLTIRTFTLLVLEKRRKPSGNGEDEDHGDDGQWIVVSHQDHWSFRSVLEGLPVVGPAYRLLKTVFGYLSSIAFALIFRKAALLD